MSEQGWITIHRSVRDHWLYEEKRTFSKYEAWIDLLMDANHTNKKTLIDGQLEEVYRGQNITSIRKLCNRWNWSNNKVTRFLNLLQEDEMIIWKSDTKKTSITIVNYDFYQSGQNEKASPRFQTRQGNDFIMSEKSTGEASGCNTVISSDTEFKGNEKASLKHIGSTSEAYQKHTNNNVNNDNNVNNKDINVTTRKKRVYDDDDPNKKLAILLLKKIRERQNIKEPDLNSWANTIRLTIEIDNRSGKEVQDMILWSSNHDFWSGVILSPTSLRKNFDKMSVQMKQKPKNNKFNSSRKESLPNWAEEAPVTETPLTEEEQAEFQRQLAELGREK